MPNPDQSSVTTNNPESSAHVASLFGQLEGIVAELEAASANRGTVAVLHTARRLHVGALDALAQVRREAIYTDAELERFDRLTRRLRDLAGLPSTV